MLWNLLYWELSEPYYKNESSKPVLLGVRVDSWSWGFDVWLLKISLVDSCVPSEASKAVICRQLWDCVPSTL